MPYKYFESLDVEAMNLAGLVLCIKTTNGIVLGAKVMHSQRLKKDPIHP